MFSDATIQKQFRIILFGLLIRSIFLFSLIAYTCIKITRKSQKCKWTNFRIKCSSKNLTVAIKFVFFGWLLFSGNSFCNILSCKRQIGNGERAPTYYSNKCIKTRKVAIVFFFACRRIFGSNFSPFLYGKAKSFDKQQNVFSAVAGAWHLHYI